MKRLVANEATDNLFGMFKDMVSLNDIARHLHDVYESWSNASVNNMIDEHYGDFGHWFDQYSSSIVQDCIGQANENVVFHDKYIELPVEDQEYLQRQINDYISDSKSDLQSIMTLGINPSEEKSDEEAEIDMDADEVDIELDEDSENERENNNEV